MLGRKRAPVAERLNKKLVRRGKCLIWTGAKNNKKEGKGYGTISVNGKTALTHVVAYELAKGPVPSGKDVRHTCDVRLCCEPSHLILGTRLENQRDMVERGRSAKGEDHSQVKLTEKQVLDIRAKYATGKYSQRKLAKEFNVSQGVISQITSRKTW